MCLVSIICLDAFFIPRKPDAKSNLENRIIMYCLVAEHVLAYFAGIFRKYDIAKNGKPDPNGVFRAPREMFLGSIEQFVDCLLLGYIIKYVALLPLEEFHGEAYTSYWILIDGTLMFLT